MELNHGKKSPRRNNQYAASRCSATRLSKIFDLIRLTIPNPPDEVWRKLEKTVKPFFEKIKNNNTEVSSLEQLRDTLLPKLLSGQLEL